MKLINLIEKQIYPPQHKSPLLQVLLILNKLLTPHKADELRYLRGEKAKLEREIEFISKDFDKLKYELAQERDSKEKLQQVHLTS